MLGTWQAGQWRNIDEEMHDLTLQIVVDALFQVKITPAADAIRTAMAELGLAVSEQAMNPLKAMSPEWLPTAVSRRKARASAKLDAIVYRLIEERRRSGVDAGDLLSMFLFGGGPRICIGNSFARMEARLLLAAIAQRYRLQLPPGFQVEVNPLATLGCKGSVPMQVNLH
jgi:cytochrome P450